MVAILWLFGETKSTLRAQTEALEVKRYRSKSKLKKLIPFLLPISCLYLVLSLVICIPRGMRVPYQIGFGLVAISYAIRYWSKSNIRYTDTIKCLLIVFWCGLSISFASGVTFDPLVYYLLFLIGIVWLIAEIIDLIKGRTRGHRLILLLGGALVGLQVVMRAEHLAGAVIAMMLSWMVLSLGFIIELILLSNRKKLDASSHQPPTR